MTDGLLKTPLHDLHVRFGARMVDSAGWSMPVQFAGIQEEHVHTRQACSAFDVSHMGRLRLIGRDVEPCLNRLCTRNLKDAQVGRSYYSHICREDGGVLDDVIVSRFEADWGIVCNASNREKIVQWIQDHRGSDRVELRDETATTAMLACQGPQTLDVARQLTGEDFSTIKRYRLTVRTFGEAQIVVYRSGYTGEDGVEIVVPAGLAMALATHILGTPEQPSTQVKPAGLGSRDTLRIEAGMPLYGHELMEEVDSLTSGQEWCVDLEKDFIGADAMRKLKTAGLPRRLVGLELEGRRIARQHFPVYHGARQVGKITSGTLSPTLGKSIAMAFLQSECATLGTTLEVEIGGKRVACRVVSPIFYQRKIKT